MIDFIKLNETIVGSYKIAHGIEDNVVVERIKRPRKHKHQWTSRAVEDEDGHAMDIDYCETCGHEWDGVEEVL